MWERFQDILFSLIEFYVNIKQYVVLAYNLNQEEETMKKWLEEHKKLVGSVIIIVGIVVAVTIILL